MEKKEKMIVQLNSISEWMKVRAELLRENKTIGFVPTMGALHEGHISLVKKSVEENDVTLVSVFINPTQFNDPKDFERYPQTRERDLLLLKECGADYVLTPQKKDIYPDDYHFKVVEDQLSKLLCGEHRPGHFDGVLTVVMKLLNIAGAKRAYFGEKDFQQYTLIKKMVEAFFHPTEIVMGKTVRDAVSGLALSSRNLLLSEKGRERAGAFNVILRKERSCERAMEELKAQGFEVDYVTEVGELGWGRRFGAARIEGVRLIDNVMVEGE